MNPQLKIFKRRGEWFYTWKVSSIYTSNPVHGPFESREEAQEDADRRNKGESR